MRKILGAVAGLSLVVAVVAPAVGADRNLAPIHTISGAGTSLQNVYEMGLGTDGTPYGVSAFDGGILAYAPSAGTNAAWVRKLAGAATLMGAPLHLAVAGNRVWADIDSQNGIAEFAGNGNGNVSPLKTIGGSNTGITAVNAIAAAPNGDVYVSNGSSILVFDSQAGGNVAPKRIITGGNTQITTAGPLAVDSAGNVNMISGSQVLTFSSNANGNVVPSRILSGAKTLMDLPFGLATDNGRNLYVSDNNTKSVSVFGPTANGNVAPLARLIGAGTQLGFVRTVAVAADRRVYVLDSTGPAIRIYAPLVPFVKAGAVRLLKVHGAKSAAARTITWAAPTANLNAGRITGYKVVIKKGTKIVLVKTVTGLSTAVKRSALKAGTFTVTIVAVNKQGSGPAAKATFKVS